MSLENEMTSKFDISAIGPFNFDLSASIFSDGDPEIRKYENGMFWQVLRTDQGLVLITVESEDSESLTVKMESTKELSPKNLKSISNMVKKIFNLDMDINPFYREVESDDVMNRITDRLHGLKNPTTPTLFEALVDSVAEQQLSLKAAHSIENRVIKSFGPSINIKGKTCYAYPKPEDLAFLELQKLRDCGLSFRKSEYIRDLSLGILNHKIDLDQIGKLESTPDMIDELRKIRGVGVWTGELAVLRGLGRLDALPADDIGLRRAISHFYRDDVRISADEAREIAHNWGKWRGLAGYYLIVAEITGLKI